MEVKGNIKFKKVEGRRRAFMIDGKWYSTFVNDDDYPGFTEAVDLTDRGDSVVLDVWKNDKGFLNINAINGIYKDGKTRDVVPEVDINEDMQEEAPPQKTNGTLDMKDICIMAQVALKEAGADRQATLLSEKPISVTETCKTVQKYFEAMIAAIASTVD